MLFGATPFSPPPGDPIWDIPRRPRYFDEVDTVTGPPSDLAKEQPETTKVVVLGDGGEWRCFINGCVFVPNAEPLDLTGMPPDEAPTPIFDEDEVDILVYQEQERAIYLEGFQAPTARSYTYIDDRDPIEDEIFVYGNPYVIEIGDNDIPMFAPGCIEIDGEWFCFG